MPVIDYQSMTGLLLCPEQMQHKPYIIIYRKSISLFKGIQYILKSKSQNKQSKLKYIYFKLLNIYSKA